MSSGSARIRAVVEAFEEAFRRRPLVSFEEFLPAASDPDRSAVLRELALVDLELRTRAGEEIEPGRYVERFPELDSPGFHADFLEIRQTGRRQREIPTAPPRLADDRYAIEAVLGRGGFGTVFRAFDAVLGRTVAIKVADRVGPDAGVAVGRTLREARLTAGLRHPNIVTVHEVGVDLDGRPFLVSEFIDGQTLAQRRARSDVDRGEIVAWIAAIADALDHTHRRGIIHRDVNPRNILVSREGVPYLIDLGLSRRTTSDSIEVSGRYLLGTPAYMAPEQIKGEADAIDGRADVYALGVVLYEMLTGTVPFRGRDASIIHAILEVEPTSPRRIDPSIPRELDAACLKAIRKEPGRRFQTAAEFAEALRGRTTQRPSRLAAGIGRGSVRFLAFLLLLTVAAGAFRQPPAPRESAASNRAGDGDDRVVAAANQGIALLNGMIAQRRRSIAPGVNGVAMEDTEVASIVRQLRVLEDHARTDPKLRESIAGQHRLIGELLCLNNRFEDAERLLGEARAYWTDLASADGGSDPRVPAGLGTVNEQIALIRAQRRGLAAAAPFHRNAVERYAQALDLLRREEGGRRAAREAWTLETRLIHRIMSVYFELGEFGRVVECGTGLLATLLERARTEGLTEPTRRSILAAADLQARAAVRMPGLVSVADGLRSAADLFDRAGCGSGTPNERSDLARLLAFHASVLDASGEQAEANTVLARVEAVVGGLDRRIQTGASRDFALVYVERGRRADRAGRSEEALASFATAERLLRGSPLDDRQRREVHAMCLHVMGNLSMDLNRPEAAAGLFRDALAERTELATEFPGLPRYVSDREGTRRNLEQARSVASRGTGTRPVPGRID